MEDLRRYQRLDPTTSELIRTLEDPDANRDDVPEGYTLREGLLMSRGLIYVPSYEGLKLKILTRAHDAQEHNHPGQAKTLEII